MTDEEENYAAIAAVSNDDVTPNSTKADTAMSTLVSPAGCSGCIKDTLDIDDEEENEAAIAVGSEEDAKPNGTKEGTVMITLVSRDGLTLTLPKSAAVCSGFIKDTLDIDDEDEEPDSYQPVHVMRVDGDCLQKVVDFLVHYQDDPLPEIQQPLVGNSLIEIIKIPWYQDYVAEENMSKSMLFRVLSAANYMTIRPLLDLACLWCTFQLAGKSAEQIRVLLNLPELTSEQEAKAREDLPWLFESDDS